MKIYEIIKGIAEELEKDRIMVIEAEKNILANEDLTIKRKNEMVREMHQKYFEKIEKANNNKDIAIDKFIERTQKKPAELNAAKLSEVLGVVKNLSSYLEDKELFEMTKEIQNDYISMGILRKEVEDPNKYPETFKELNKKELIDNVLTKLSPFKGLYFSTELNYPHIKYSLNTLIDIDNELERIEKSQDILFHSSYVEKGAEEEN